ncbi:hypothetical protein Q4534_18255 [Cyclobacterium sp. 1_MG-2023]|uniref:hypothetical protein n=1 Tax=Cyclobacterium sp. 1_MG-2023 TaxID=3062681 RepID=UPI0026E2900F|nr:hypothetical protein [Cyclobacterium sp. 1_MG-2023]MDO6439373.1 hypothetical protein [Cyclobacterium sp. 1_MG-2023]
MNLILPNYLFLLLMSLYFWKGGGKNNVLSLLIIDLSQFPGENLRDYLVLVYYRKVLSFLLEIVNVLKKPLIFCLNIRMTYLSLVETMGKLNEIEKGWIHFELPRWDSKMRYGRLYGIDGIFFNRQTFVNLK